MTDVHSPEQRSYNMSRIRSGNTKPEMVVRRFLFANGFRYRIHDNRLPGKPDIVLPKYKTVIFIHGCFWHGHEGCRYFSIPKTRTEWWREKINRNRSNDQKNIELIKNKHWKVITIYECRLRTAYLSETLSDLIREISGNSDGRDSDDSIRISGC